MSVEVRCADLGIANCDVVFRGEDVQHVVQQVVDYFRSEHDIDMPDANIILSADVSEASFWANANADTLLNDTGMETRATPNTPVVMFEDLDEDARLVVRRLRKVLALQMPREEGSQGRND